MANKTLAKLKTELLFNTDLTHVVDAMKGIAASQYHVMEHRMTAFKRVTESLPSLFTAYDFRRSRHPFVRLRGERKLICAVTTDSGFTGGLNMKVIQAAVKHQGEGSHFLALGERGANYFREFQLPHTAYPGISVDESRFQLAEEVAAKMALAVTKGLFDQVMLVYPHSLAFAAQRVETLNLIPCPLFFKDRPPLVKGVDPNQGVILESPAAGVIEYLTGLWMRKRLVETFEDAKLSEFGARTMHLEDSYSTLKKIDKQLRLQYFKARREKIDQSLRESFVAQMVCK